MIVDCERNRRTEVRSLVKRNHKFLASLSILVSALTLSAVGTASAAPADAGSLLWNEGSQLCAWVYDPGMVADVGMRACDSSSPNEKWILQPIGGGLYHVSTTGNYCLSMTSADPFTGWPTMTQPCGLNLYEEQWQVTQVSPGSDLRAFYSPDDGRYLDANDTKGVSRAVMGPNNGAPTVSQSWLL